MSNSKKKFAPCHLHLHHTPPWRFFFSDSCTRVPGYMEFCFFFKSMYPVHGILFLFQIHVPGYMEFCFFFKSMYPGYMNLREKIFAEGVWHYQGVGVQEAWCKFVFGNLTHFFDIHFKNTFNLIFLGFKVLSERFFHKNSKTGLTFWNMWF